jgi:Ca-activated chloride channel family protein
MRLGMGRGLLLLLASVAMTPVTSFGQQPEAPEQPTFKSGVDLVTVTATVRDKRGRLVRGLGKSDFEVLDSGQRRAITEFRDDPSPVSLAILFDISGSMRIADRLTAARFAARHVLSWLQDGRDEAALLTFDSRLHEVAPFTVDTRALQGALGEVDPFGATSLHDAIAEAAKRAATRTGRRRAVVVITDGIDTSSSLTPGEVSAIASSIDVPVYVIATVLPIDHPGREGSVRPEPESIDIDASVANLATWTGGASYYASTPADTSHAARQVLDELRQQYVLAFEPARATGWRPLEIRTRDKDYIVRARSGYMAGNARSQVDGGTVVRPVF